MGFFIRTFSIFVLVLTVSIAANAQMDPITPGGRPTEEPLPQNIKETLAKQRIEDNKKEYEELLARGKKALELSDELQKSYTQNQKLSGKDAEKLKDLEKLLKKIRSDLGGEGDNEEEVFEKPTSTSNALDALKNTANNLFEEIKKTSRHTFSAVAIKSSNTIINIVKFLRLSN